MENIILQFLNIYFWVFLVFLFLNFLVCFSSEYQENRKNAIKNGVYRYNTLQNIIGWSIFILSVNGYISVPTN